MEAPSGAPRIQVRVASYRTGKARYFQHELRPVSGLRRYQVSLYEMIMLRDSTMSCTAKRLGVLI